MPSCGARSRRSIPGSLSFSLGDRSRSSQSRSPQDCADRLGVAGQGWDLPGAPTTSGPAAKAAAFKGRIHGCTRTLRRNVRFLLHRGRRPYMAPGSTGRRNTGVKSLRWGLKLQGLTGAFVELTSHFVQISLRVYRQVGAPGKVLSEETIGVFIRTALPRALRIAKINVDVGRQRKLSMIRKFLATVPGQRLIEFAW